MSAAWTAALDDFESRVAALEAALARGELDGLPGRWEQPPDLVEVPSPEQRARAEAVLARARSCEAQLFALLQVTSSALHELRARSDAAASYANQPSTSGTRGRA